MRGSSRMRLHTSRWLLLAACCVAASDLWDRLWSNQNPDASFSGPHLAIEIRISFNACGDAFSG
jgi:hypothetical protein